MISVVAVVPAAGFGRRLGTATNKQFLKLGGVPISIFTMRRLAAVSEIDAVLPVIRPDEIDLFLEKILSHYPVDKLMKPVPGGPERQDSVYNALKSMDCDPEIVLIHDGVRPFFRASDAVECIRIARECGGAAVALQAVDTVRRGSSEVFGETLDRTGIYLMQTPQVFRFRPLLTAYEKLRGRGLKVTDDVAVYESDGGRVRIVAGSRFNFKITTPEDLYLARQVKKYGRF
ncbi:MAG: 2-C-methyl-D-erythritol 4-phosphate cytidylyltransferase [Candidatus Wallbacteria bacterium]|nr:2-C-methyl-D-erythritol 4-phosphate cytidylyltransferase [Candidatus Wallbacteria bacterium]